MEQKSVWQMTLDARKDARQTVGPVHYSPWLLALSVSMAWGLLVFGTLGAYVVSGWLVAFFTGGLIAPFPLLVTAWTFAAWEVELDRLGLGRALLSLPDVPAPVEAGESDAPAGPVELAPGYELNGEIVAPMRALTAEAAALRDVCLLLVKGGMRRGGWSRSKLAEGERAWMKADAWDRASKELQRLGFFRKDKAGLMPARDLGDILKRLEAAR